MPARILIVEDDGVVAETLEAYLQQAGYEVTRVRDGRQGLAVAEAGAHALVILDLMVPGLGGLDVCRQLRRSSRVRVRRAETIRAAISPPMMRSAMPASHSDASQISSRKLKTASRCRARSASGRGWLRDLHG